MPSNSDFNRGLCDCGNVMFSLRAKYAIGKLVKAGRDDLVWQWYCNQCGMVHHEPCEVSTHRQRSQRIDDPISLEPFNKKPYGNTGLDHVTDH